MKSPESSSSIPTREQTLQLLRDQLKNYSSDIPEGAILGHGAYKVRGSWLQGAISLLRFANETCLNDQLEDEIERVAAPIIQRRSDALKAVSEGKARDSFVKTTQEEIESIDALLGKVIELIASIEGTT